MTVAAESSARAHTETRDLDLQRPTVWIVHSSLTDNLGDRLIGQGFSSLLLSLGYEPTTFDLVHGRKRSFLSGIGSLCQRFVTSNLPSDLMFREVDYCLGKARPSAIIIGGGQLLLPNRKFLTGVKSWINLASKYEVPIGLFSVGGEYPVGRFVPEVEWDRLRSILRELSAVRLRDSHTCEWLESITGRRFPVVPDVAYGLASLDLNGEQGKQEGVIVSPASFESVVKYLPRLERAHYHDHFLSGTRQHLEHNERVTVVCTTKRDLDEGKVLANRLKQAGVVPIADIVLPRSPFDLLRVIATHRVLVGSRMHALIAGHLTGLEVIPVFRNEKVKAFAQEQLRRAPEVLRAELRSAVVAFLRDDLKVRTARPFTGGGRVREFP